MVEVTKKKSNGVQVRYPLLILADSKAVAMTT